MHHNVLLSFILAVFMTMGIPASFTYAESINIVNNVSSSASTGGNSASAGETSEGHSSASVHVETTINGEEVTNIDKHVESDTGEPVEASVSTTNTVGVDDEKSTTTIHTEVKTSTSDAKKESSVSAPKAELEEETASSSVASTSVEAEVELETENKIVSTLKTFFTHLFSYVFKLF